MTPSRLLAATAALLTFTVAVNLVGTTRTLAQEDSQEPAWHVLFDGKSLDGWKSTQFGGEGDVSVDEGIIVLEMGSPLTGITYSGDDLPKTDFEIRLEAKRLDGVDFFCALTFPVAESHCTFVVGGWAGAIVGLSNVDGKDASENDTTRFMRFENDRWYKIRVRVTTDRISAWIDDKEVVSQSLKGKTIDTRPEVILNKPLGLSSFQTRAGIRGLEIRRLSPE